MADIVLSLAYTVLDKLGSYVAGKIKSSWLVKEHLRKLQRSLDTICPFIEDAEKRQSDSNLIRKWVRDLKDVVYDIDDLLDEAAADILELDAAEGEGSNKREKVKVRKYLSSAKKKIISKTIAPFSLSTKIHKILDRLEEIDASTSNLKLVAANLTLTVPFAQSSHHRITYPLPFVNKSDSIKGRDKAKSEILDRVLRNDIECSFGLSVLPIVGIGGLGKTTLAQLVYSDPTIEKQFKTKFWACVSDPFKLELVLERLLEVKGLGMAQMVGMLGSKVREKKYFMVLDDIWTRNKSEWDSLKEILVGGGAEGSVILVTTRDKEVATRTIGVKNPCELEQLPFDLCMSVFIENAFGTKEEYERYPYLAGAVKDIVKKCGGVPLAAKTLGSSLRGERDEGKWYWVAESDLWKTEQKGGILAALKLSYNALGSPLKLCFAYLSIFPKDDELEVDDVIAMWIAQGLIKRDDAHDELEDTGYKYLEELVSRSLLLEVDISINKRVCKCKMHDLVHDLATEVTGEELGLVSWYNPSLPRSVRHIAWYEADDLSDKEEIPRELIVGAGKVRTFKWSYRTESINKTFIEQIISAFQRIRVLDLGGSNFEELPDSIGNLKHLRYLNLSLNRSIKALPISICKLLNLQALSLIRCDQLEELPGEMEKLINLRYLELTFQSRTLMVGLPSLRILRLLKCHALQSLLQKVERGSAGLKEIFPTQLRVLHIMSCPKLSYVFADTMEHLTALRKLVISNCESLDWEMESTYGRGRGRGGTLPEGLRSLELLEIRGIPKMVDLPCWLDTAALSLRYVNIEDCSCLCRLPNWMRKCNCLVLCNCPNLSALPPEVLPSLQKLHIVGCPDLRLDCDVSHIPDCVIEDDNIFPKMDSESKE